jgi:hypothetical protein
MKGDEPMKLLLSVLGALSVLAVAGCTVLPSRPGAVVGDFMVTLSVNYHYERAAHVFQGDSVQLSLSLINRGRPRTLVLSKRPAYDFVVTTSGGVEVWRWSYGKAVEISVRREGYWKLRQPMLLTLKLRNVTERTIELTLLGRPAYDFIVTTDYGRREVWRWSRRQAIQEIAELRRLAPWEALEFSVEWDQHDSAGNLIAPGRYCVQGLVHVDPAIEEQPMQCILIGRGLPVALVLDVPERVKLGESVPLVWKIINESDCPVTLVDIGLDFMVTTFDGSVIFSSIKRWSRFAPPMKPIESTIITLQPGETRAFEGTWDQLDDEDYPVKPGVYLVRGFLWATQETDAPDVVQSAPQRLVIEP